MAHDHLANNNMMMEGDDNDDLNGTTANSLEGNDGIMGKKNILTGYFWDDAISAARRDGSLPPLLLMEHDVAMTDSTATIAQQQQQHQQQQQYQQPPTFGNMTPAATTPPTKIYRSARELFITDRIAVLRTLRELLRRSSHASSILLSSSLDLQEQEQQQQQQQEQHGHHYQNASANSAITTSERAALAIVNFTKYLIRNGLFINLLNFIRELSCEIHILDERIRVAFEKRERFNVNGLGGGMNKENYNVYNNNHNNSTWGGGGSTSGWMGTPKMSSSSSSSSSSYFDMISLLPFRITYPP